MDAGSGHPRGAHTAEHVACTVAAANGPWTSQGFSARTGRFIADFTATPSESPTDAVVGFSAGPASWFLDLAAIVRFNPSGLIDVRAGAGYQADVTFPYAAGTPYRFRLDIDVGSHLYSVTVQNQSGDFTSLAQSYPFRTEQAQVPHLGNLSTQVDSSSGTIEVCDLRITGIDVPGCPSAVAGGGFVDQSIGQPGEVLVFSDFVATPDQLLDGVIGLSPTRATSFDDVAATVRFSPIGVVDARNGDAYQADFALPYAAGQSRRIRIIANVPTHTFSAYVATGGLESVQLARRYAFRTTQSAATFLGDLNGIVDSAQGAMSICNARHTISIGVRMAREGNYAVAPLPADNEALISDATTTLHVTGNGQTLAQLGAGGQVAVDPAGNVYLARITGTDLVVEAYTAGFALRWTGLEPVGANKRVVAIAADAASVMVASGPASGSVDRLKHWLTDGTPDFTHAGAVADVIGVGPTGYVLGRARNGTVTITKWAFLERQPEWQNAWQNSANIAVMALGPSGQVYFSGSFTGPISFGGPVVEPRDGLSSVFLAALSTSGGHVFTRDIDRGPPHSLASNGRVIAMSRLISPRGPRLRIFDSQGQDIVGEAGQTGFGSSGNGGAVTVGPSDRVYWNFGEAWPAAFSPIYPYLISLDPGV